MLKVLSVSLPMSLGTSPLLGLSSDSCRAHDAVAEKKVISTKLPKTKDTRRMTVCARIMKFSHCEKVGCPGP